MFHFLNLGPLFGVILFRFGDIFGLSEHFLKQKFDSITIFSYKASKFEKLVFTNTLTTRFEYFWGSPKSMIFGSWIDFFMIFGASFAIVVLDTLFAWIFDDFLTIF